MRLSRYLSALVCLCGIAATRPATAAEAPLPATPSGPAILQDLKAFQQMASVLMIAAHPDDENTGLITYLARGRGYRMAYLSVTRGDGGQNLIGAEFSEELGLIRTHELLAARNLDKGRQYFTRAIDFGYSKTAEETLRIWDRAAVLGDVVRVIRTFRPDVIVTRFNPTGTGTHGHHTGSAVLGVEAFALAGDASKYPEQIREGGGGLAVWQPKRIFLNGGGGGRGGGGGAAAGAGAVVAMNSAGNDPLLNMSFGQIAGQSRALHRSQGVGGGFGGGQESFRLLAGEAATTDIMDGIDTTWGRVAGGAAIAARVEAAIGAFDPQNTAASVPALLEIKKLVDALPTPVPADPILVEKRRQIDRIIADCLGLSVHTTVPNALVTPGETLQLHSAATVKAAMPVRWIETIYAKGTVDRDTRAVALKPGEVVVSDVTQKLAAGTPVSQPYWLEQDPAPGIYKVADATLIGQPVNPPAFPVQYVFEVGDQRLRIDGEPVQYMDGAAVPVTQQRRALAVIAPVSFSLDFDVALFRPGESRQVKLEVMAARASEGSVEIKAAPGWKVEPAAQPFKLAAAGSKTTLSVNVTAPANPGRADLAVQAVVGGIPYSNQRKEIVYPHLPALLLQPPAVIRTLAVDLQHKGRTIGYLPGAGDSVAQALVQMGYEVKELAGKDLNSEGLKGLDAVVVGVRAFNTRTDLAGNVQGLFEYAAAGGTVVEQYNRPDQLRNNTLAPFPLRLSSLRVTDENAKVTFLVPDSPALTAPNKITESDFAGWVQERNIYLPDQFDSRFTPILGMADPGETPPNSSLLIAQHGKGYFVYTSLVFFRELPAGNPGAYRLFANLLSLGKP